MLACAFSASIWGIMVIILITCLCFGAMRPGRRGQAALWEQAKKWNHVPTLSTLISIFGLMILYQRYMHHINHLLPSKLPVRQNGCVKEAEGVKYFSMVLRWVEGGDCVRRWIIWGISASVAWVSGWVMWHDGAAFTWVFHGRRAL